MSNFYVQETFHAFKIVPVNVGSVMIQKGIVHASGESFTAFDVEGALEDINMNTSSFISMENGGTVGVLITHSPKSETSAFVTIEGCEISTASETPDEDTATLVNIGSVTWDGNLAEVDQELKSDIYCAIYGNKVEST